MISGFYFVKCGGNDNSPVMDEYTLSEVKL